uniref:Uncharacterized protein n=1 Tax=Rhizophora mucronata TaxID=61149 RepID=A0A2P2M4X9_RHIMU
MINTTGVCANRYSSFPANGRGSRSSYLLCIKQLACGL